MNQSYDNFTFPETVFPNGNHCLGASLHRMTLGHAILLHRLQNPFVKSSRYYGKDVGVHYADLLEAAFVCSRDWQTAARQANNRFCACWMKWKWITRRNRVIEDVKAMVKYVADQWSILESLTPHYSSIHRSEEILSPLVTYCCSQRGISRDDAMWTPLQIALWDYFKSGISTETGCGRREQLSIRG